jgi:RNA polymerase sigma-70 factor (ECF subfamily)
VTAVKSFSQTASGRTEGVERPKLQDFEGIYRRYNKRVYSLCLRMTCNEADAQDLTQEAFLQLFRKLDTFRGESAFYTWFHRLVVNIVLMRLRTKRRLMETSLEGSLEPDSHAGLPSREIPTPDNGLLGVIDQVSLRRALEGLPLGYRIVFVLHDIEGYEHNEISEMVARSVGTSKSQLHKARLRLRELLAGGQRRSPAAEPPAARISMPVERLVAA